MSAIFKGIHKWFFCWLIAQLSQLHFSFSHLFQSKPVRHLSCNYDTTKQSERTSNPNAAARHTKKRAVWNRRIIRRHGEWTLAPRPRSNQLVPFIISHKDQAVWVRTVLRVILHQRLRVLELNLVTAGYLSSLMTGVHTQKVFSKVQVHNATTIDP